MKQEPKIFKQYSLEKIRRVRKALGYTQDDIADICGIHRTTYNRFERGHYLKPSNVYLVGVCLERLIEQCEDINVKNRAEKLMDASI
jgi:DNA-binding XRE family transcriptional regulator